MRQFLSTLTTEKILNEPLPIQKLISDSLYYPSAGFDGGVVEYFSQQFQSFVYCDYGIEEDDFLNQIDTFHGYSILAQRHVLKEEITPEGWRPEIPPGLTMHDYFRERGFIKKPFANWAIYERNPDKDHFHGPERFSVIYISGEGVATYQALYWTHQTSAKAVAMIQPGNAWGGNWANFRDPEGPFAWVLAENPHGTPETIIHGGHGNFHQDLHWSGYQYSHTIENYYGYEGEVSIYNRIN